MSNDNLTGAPGEAHAATAIKTGTSKRWQLLSASNSTVSVPSDIFLIPPISLHVLPRSFCGKTF